MRRPVRELESAAVDRRTFLAMGSATMIAGWLSGCGSEEPTASVGEPSVPPPGFRMPAEEEPHDATWMSFPGRPDVWGVDLPEVQSTIADIALAVAGFEPVRMLARSEDLGRAAQLVGSDVELIEAPVDDLWARDTLPLFLVSDSDSGSGSGALAAGRVRFNGWGGKQVHSGDAVLADLVADVTGVSLFDSGLVGEGGGLETDGAGTLLAARSSWVNDNRNPGVAENDIARRLAELLGAERLLWVDGIAGADITDGHIDTLARFVDPSTIVNELPSYVEPGETWYDLAIRTRSELEAMVTLDGAPYELVTLRQPESVRRNDAEFLSSYVNYYVCNGAVLVPEFGDPAADGAAAERIEALYPGRQVVAVGIDPVAAGGGGIHCATQQQPAVF